MFRLAAFLGISWARCELVLVSSGGCDSADHKCVEGEAWKEEVVHAVNVAPGGGLKAEPRFGIDVGGMPVWLTVHDNSKGEYCLFISRADKNDIASVRFAPDGGRAARVGTFSTGGAAPVFTDVLTTPGGKNVLLVANYHGPDNANTSAGASAASMMIDDDCGLRLADVKNHSGHSVNPQRQGGSHVHSFVASRDGIHGFACDLGQDRIFVYTVSEDGVLTQDSVVETPLGAGPRHSVERGDWLYVVTEMGMTVLVYKKAADIGLQLVQTLPLFPKGGGAGSKAAEIVMQADLPVLYATNRGLLNTVTVFAIGTDGMLEQKQQVSAPSYPRGMSLASNGEVLLVAGQTTAEVMSYTVDKAGMLSPGRTLENVVPHPAAFAPLRPPNVSTRVRPPLVV